MMRDGGATASMLRFADLEINLQTEQVWRAGQEVHLSPKCYKLLKLFVDHANKLVTKKQIFDAVWPHQEVGDATLNQTMSILRKALGFDAAQFRSVPRRGYIFTLDPAQQQAEVETKNATDASPAEILQRDLPPAPLSNSRQRPQLSRRWIVITSALALLLASTYAFVSSLYEPKKIDRLSLEVRAPDQGLAAAFRAVLVAELDPSVKVINDRDADFSASTQMLFELTTDPRNPSRISWQWQLTQDGTKKHGQAASVIVELANTLRADMPNALPLRQNLDARTISDQAFELYAEAMRSLSSGQIKQAKPLLERAVTLAPNNSILLLEIAKLCQELGEMRLAKIYFGQLAGLKNDPQVQLFAKFKLAAMDNQEQTALDVLEQLVMDETEKSYLRIRLYTKLNRLDLAEKELELHRKAGHSVANNPEFGYLSGIILEKRFNYPPAIEIYSLALKNTNLTPFWRGQLAKQLGGVYGARGEYAKAEELYITAADSFDPDRNMDEQFSAQRVILNLRVAKTKECYRGKEIERLEEIAINKIGSVRAMTGYFATKSQIEWRCGNFSDAVSTLSQSIKIAKSVEEMAYQTALLYRAQLFVKLGDSPAARADIKAIRASTVQKLTPEEIDYIDVRAGASAVSQHTMTCFTALRAASKSTRTALAQECIAAKTVIDTPNRIHFELAQFIAAGEPAELTPSLRTTVADADPIDLMEWEAFCAVAQVPACR
jgi:DNA-binding winged helix-turn-helix (wHTH) protein